MVHMIFAELTLIDGKVESCTATEGMEWFLNRPVLSGGAGWLYPELRTIYHLLKKYLYQFLILGMF